MYVFSILVFCGDDQLLRKQTLTKIGGMSSHLGLEVVGGPAATAAGMGVHARGEEGAVAGLSRGRRRGGGRNQLRKSARRCASTP